MTAASAPYNTEKTAPTTGDHHNEPAPLATTAATLEKRRSKMAKSSESIYYDCEQFWAKIYTSIHIISSVCVTEYWTVVIFKSNTNHIYHTWDGEFTLGRGGGLDLASNLGEILWRRKTHAPMHIQLFVLFPARPCGGKPNANHPWRLQIRASATRKSTRCRKQEHACFRIKQILYWDRLF